MAEAVTEGGTGGKASVRLGESFDIYPDRPLPELRSPNAPAYMAVDRDRPTGSSFALICDANHPPRLDAISAQHGLRGEAMLLPQQWGIVDWPLGDRRSFAIILDRPSGGRLAQALTDRIDPIKEDDLVHNLLPPLTASLRELASSGLTHRAIRPTNLFYRDAARRVLVLGDSLSAPPAAFQPMALEPIESAMAMAAGRGNGNPGDDLYALGATIIFLLLGYHPTTGISDEQVLAEKVSRGSYNALLRGKRVGGAIVELLRGLLNDDLRERWGVQDVEMWLEGRRMTPKPPALAKRATRAFQFVGQDFFTARALAHAYSRDPLAAVKALKGQDFEIWMERSLNDETRSKMLDIAMSDGRDSGLSGHDERLVARVCIALDPQAPVRYKNFSAMVDGFGTMLVAAFRGQGQAQTIAEALAGRLPQFWFSAQSELKPENVPILKGFERLRLYLDDRRPGFGIERILYEMNPGLHCLSPMIETDFVVEASGALKALERASERRTGDDLVIDRHLAAFLASRFRLGGDDWHDSLASADMAQRVLGALYLLTRLQTTYGPPAAPALAQRIGRQIPAVIERFHNRARRKRLSGEFPKLVSKGNLGSLLSLVDNAAERQRDAFGFHYAQREFATIERELTVLRIDTPKRPERAVQLGARYAASAASLLAWLMALVVIAATG
ncbi:MAG TPA: serine/threonine-protein kinase [Stellaceae bacterium]|nr:serine/threonine-protein kinase [Stellaceae bacterium]